MLNSPQRAGCKIVYRRIQANLAIYHSQRVGAILADLAGKGGRIADIPPAVIAARIPERYRTEAQRLMELSARSQRRRHD